MRDIVDFVAVAEPDDAREIVLHDSEMIAVVVDVGRQKKRISASRDQLLALVRGLPIHFQRKLVSLDDAWRLSEPFPHLGEERQIPVCSGLVCYQQSIGDLTSSSLGSLLDEGPRTWVVPALRAKSGRSAGNHA